MKLETHPFSLRQLQYAVAVADELSFSRAAVRCHVSQPSLSAQVAQLEAALGTQLFERDRRRVLPTTAGAPILERARAILREVDDLADQARESADPLAGTLRLGVIPTISPYLVPHIRPALRRAFPKLKLYWFEEKTPALMRRLAAGELDGAIVALEADIGDVEHEVIGFDPFVLASTVGHPITAGKTAARRSELGHENVLLLDDGQRGPAGTTLGA